MRRFLLLLVIALVLIGIGICLGVMVDRHLNPPVKPPAQFTGASLQPCPDEYVLTRFQQLWFESRPWAENRWLGIQTLQYPTDVWVTQEILFDTKPDFVVECGSYRGGSAAAWATFLKETNPEGRVISIDIEDRMGDARKLPICKERVDFLVGSSIDPKIVAEVTRRVTGKKVFVLLDSLHTKEHVLSELRNYSPLVSKGQYIEVQDTALSRHPIKAGLGGGAHEAVQEFLASTDAFMSDGSRNRMILSCSPGGYLKRVK